MPRSKKKKPVETRKRSTNRANLFFIANIILILFLGYLRISFNIDTFAIVSMYLLITIVSLAILRFKDRRAADEALEMLGGP